jgi:hypothetical protein
LEGAFTRDGNDLDLTEQTKALQERTVSQAGGKAPEVFFEQNPGDIATQGALAVELAVLLGLGTEGFALAQPPTKIVFQESRLQAALEQQLIDEQKLIAQVAVIDIALDGGQGLRQQWLKGNNNGVRHSARV